MQCLQNTNIQLLSQWLTGEVITGTGLEQLNADDKYICVRDTPTPLIFFMYAFIVPTLASFGLCANFINAIVFMRPKMTPSAFSYLAALSFLDCVSCLLITLTALSRSLLSKQNVWLVYDFGWQMALFGITTGSANLILACVSCDRLIYLWQGIPTGTPSFCRRKVARYMIASVLLLAIFLNIPYFFVFVVNDDNTFHPTEFYYTRYYRVHNWITFVILAVFPAIFLLIGNAAIIIAFRRWTKQSKICHKKCGAKTTQKRYQHQMKLTITILIVISLYLVGELPAHLTSWKSALNLLYGGDISKVDFKLMEKLEVICITLNALQLSMNIIIYAVINPSFMPEFFTCLRGASDTCFRLCGCTTMTLCWRGCFGRKRSDSDDEQDAQVPPVPSKHNLPGDSLDGLCCAEPSSSCADMMTAEIPPLACHTQCHAAIKTVCDAVEQHHCLEPGKAATTSEPTTKYPDYMKKTHSAEPINAIVNDPSWQSVSKCDDFAFQNFAIETNEF